MKNKQMILKIFFSSIFLGMAILKLINKWFESKVDITFISLILISFLPWLSGYLKSVEAFGIKAEFIPKAKKEEIDKVAEKVVELNKETIKGSKNQLVGSSSKLNSLKDDDIIAGINDPIVKMVVIRYEIEKSLKDLCSINFENRKNLQNIRSMADELCKHKIITADAHNLIFDLMPVLNSAVHANITIKEYDNVMWIIDKGIVLIDYLRLRQKNINK